MEKVTVQSSWLTHIGLGWSDQIRYLALLKEDGATLCLHPQSEKIFRNVVNLEEYWNQFVELEEKYLMDDQEIKSIVEIAMETLLQGSGERKVEGEIRRLIARRNSIISDVMNLIDKRVIKNDGSDKSQIQDKLVELTLFEGSDEKVLKKGLKLIAPDPKKPSKKQETLINDLIKYRFDNKKEIQKLHDFGARSLSGLLQNRDFMTEEVGEKYGDLLRAVRRLSEKVKLIIEDSPIIKSPARYSKFGIMGTYINMMGLSGECGYPTVNVNLSDIKNESYIKDLISQVSGGEVLGRVVFYSEETKEATLVSPNGNHYNVTLDIADKESLSLKTYKLRVTGPERALVLESQNQ